MKDDLVKLDPNEDNEIALIGNDGFVSGKISNAENAREVILLINYIIRNRWVDEWVPNIAME